MVCLAPRGPGESVGPRRLSAVVVRPLNLERMNVTYLWARRTGGPQ